MNEAINKYGWSAVETKTGYDLLNSKGKKVVDIKVKGSKYVFFDMGNYKLLSGNKNVVEAAVELLTKYYYCVAIA